MDLQQLHQAYQQWWGKPDYVLSIVAPNQGDIPKQFDPKRLDIVYYFSEDIAEEFVTNIATVGMATYQMNSPSSRAELMLDIDIGISRSNYKKLGRGLANLVWNCLSRGLSFVPNEAIRDISLPLFEKMNSLFVMDLWGYQGPQWLPNIETDVTVLRVVPIYESEVEQIEQIEVTIRTLVFEQAIKNSSNPDREPVRLLTEATRKIWQGLEIWLQENAPKVCENFAPGASADDIKTLEERIGMSLPEEFTAYLMVHNGQMWFGSYEYLNTERIYKAWSLMNELKNEQVFSKPHHQIDPVSEGIIKNTWWDWHWIPFGEDGCGNMLCIDLDPDVNGRVGQVIYWEKYQGPLPAGYQSFFAWFRSLEEGLGRYYLVDKDGQISEER